MWSPSPLGPHMGTVARRIDSDGRIWPKRQGRKDGGEGRGERGEDGGQAVVGELEDSRGPAKDLDYRGSIQLASRHVKYYCPPRFIHSIFKRGERKALRRPPSIFHYWIILPAQSSAPFFHLGVLPPPGRRCSTTTTEELLSSRVIVPQFLLLDFSRFCYLL